MVLFFLLTATPMLLATAAPTQDRNGGAANRASDPDDPIASRPLRLSDYHDKLRGYSHHVSARMAQRVVR